MSTPTGPRYVYRARCVRVIDGDTFVAAVDLGFYAAMLQLRVRLAGVNAPELHGSTAPAGAASRATLERLVLPRGSGADLNAAGEWPLLLASHHDERSFERWVCDVWTADGDNIADELVALDAAVRVARR
jgi:endonuclease YncB( thermonuclease family)